MYALAILGVLSFLLCLVLTPLCRDVFIRLGFVDHPDNHRKIHIKPIPRVGGLAIALSYVGALAFVIILAPKGAILNVQHRELMFRLAPAVGIVFIVGLIDDLVGLRPSHKLAGQFIAAVMAVAAGIRINVLSGHAHGALITIPLTIIWMLACTNAFNLIDGMDGLASGIGLFATATILLAAILQGNWGLATATIPLVGCLVAFLVYNFNPASVFLGDCGSLSIGFILGCFGVIWSQKSATLLGMAAPMMALALPLLDVGLSIGRRFLGKKPIFGADRGHMHHRLLAQGLHPRVAALVLYAACSAGAILSLLASSLSYHLGGLCIILFCSLSWFGIKRLRYVEFSTARRVLRSGSLLHVLQQEIYLQSLRESLHEAGTTRECWQIVRTACQDLQFASLEMTLADQSFAAVFDDEPTGATWQMTMRLGKQGKLNLSRNVQTLQSGVMTSFFHVLHECLDTKILADGAPDLTYSEDTRSMAASATGSSFKASEPEQQESMPVHR